MHYKLFNETSSTIHSTYIIARRPKCLVVFFDKSNLSEVHFKKLTLLHTWSRKFLDFFSTKFHRCVFMTTFSFSSINWRKWTIPQYTFRHVIGKHKFEEGTKVSWNGQETFCINNTVNFKLQIKLSLWQRNGRQCFDGLGKYVVDMTSMGLFAPFYKQWEKGISK